MKAKVVGFIGLVVLAVQTAPAAGEPTGASTVLRNDGVAATPLGNCIVFPGFE
jgi:hypothetical protein